MAYTLNATQPLQQNKHVLQKNQVECKKHSIHAVLFNKLRLCKVKPGTGDRSTRNTKGAESRMTCLCRAFLFSNQHQVNSTFLAHIRSDLKLMNMPLLPSRPVVPVVKPATALYRPVHILFSIEDKSMIRDTVWSKAANDLTIATARVETSENASDNLHVTNVKGTNFQITIKLQEILKELQKGSHRTLICEAEEQFAHNGASIPQSSKLYCGKIIQALGIFVAPRKTTEFFQKCSKTKSRKTGPMATRQLPEDSFQNLSLHPTFKAR